MAANKQFVVIVTGANKGIGLECVRVLAARVNSSYLFKKVGAESSVIYLASRDEERGKAALKEITAAEGVDVRLGVLDVSSTDSISKFAAFIKGKHETVHALINNAGVADGAGGRGSNFDSKTVEWVFKVNYDGVHATTDAFLPLMHEYGRIVNISSGLTRLAAPALKEKLLKVSSVSEADSITTEFRNAVKEGTAEKLGYPTLAYPCSKILLNALTIGFAADNKATHPHLLFKYVNPGWVKTDMGGSAAPGTVQQGADTPCWAAVDDISGTSGSGLATRSQIEW
ncbi:carbonyl reductase [Calocera viscosa TUFC12733]|uniref:Carbonyl reductase n=1 Tax=Calocera viscosa (strain TUFC12733) TaxID=1330018 RepID=A0A167QIQ4_CALVF|nr:carbonyl reductase [Calocera viscosa TUFC12733]